MTNDQAAKLVAQWRAGDQQAATELFQRYAGRLVALARGRLSHRVRRHLDPEDVVQSVYRIFYAQSREGRYDLQCGGDLWQLLVTMTLNKIKNQTKHLYQAKRAVDRQQNFGSEDSLLGLRAQALAREPTPLESVVLTDLVEQIMQKLDSLSRRVVELRLQGHTLEEIAAATQFSERTVCRILDEVKQHLEQVGLQQPR